MTTIQVIIYFGKWIVDKNPKNEAIIHTSTDKNGREYVEKVELPMRLISSGKQVIHMKKEALANINFKDLARELKLIYISHKIIN